MEVVKHYLNSTEKIMNRYTIKITFKSLTYTEPLVEEVKTFREALSYTDMIDDTVQTGTVTDNVTGNVVINLVSNFMENYTRRKQNHNESI